MFPPPDHHRQLTADKRHRAVTYATYGSCRMTYFTGSKGVAVLANPQISCYMLKREEVLRE